ncbi:GH92 family glycosyl hydrolase [Catenulispora sp. NF23]|uniref:GH92 family glycosyl hydrolase n=1 Tax=Catenulispora pinistramenti TaxID=2705254 RepID=UPI001BA969B1|nr:GH92 family glycosyl hydrolase [Catenulispora pinistramenti]MBS2536321.1 GH92 family glycosyl hydrolase [Catenulispora pinistramenti]
MTDPSHSRRRKLRLSSLISSGALVAAATLGTTGLSAGAAHAGSHPAFVADPASTVSTLLMTSAGGNDFPGADTPFGMVQWSPDSATDRTPGGGYDYTDTQTRGFSLTHMSGPGCNAMGDLPVLPLTGALPSGNPETVYEPLDHSSEVGQAGYYTVKTGTTPVQTELTTTAHTGMARFTFPATNQADLLMKLLDSENGTTGSSVQLVGNNEVVGTVDSGGFCTQPGPYTLHFDMVFDQPFTAASQIVTESGQPGPNSVFLQFDASVHQVVQAKVGISFVSAANASANLAAENPGFDFDATHAAAHNAWNALLGKVQIAGGTTAQQQLFYSTLYHVMLHPNTVTDVNGQYMGFDNAVHTAPPGHAQYDQFSGWDVYKGQTQLEAMLDPSVASDHAQSLVNDYTQGGLFPQWGFMNSYNWTMDGDPAVAAIANYYAFGGTDFDTSTALSDMVTEASTTNHVRPGNALEDTYGYLPSDLYTSALGCCHVRDSASSLIEYDNADFALSRFAKSMGDRSDATKFTAQANNWKNIFNPANNLLNPRESNGTFDPITPDTTTGFTEATAAQNRFDVGFDQPALAALYGGNSVINADLDYYFPTAANAKPDQASLSNEVDLGTPWFYDWTGEPSHTQSVVNRIENLLYQDSPGGFPNNDDLGAESAQYVWGALGMYPVTPGSADLAFNSPLFTQIAIHLDSGNTVAINAPAASASNYYVQSLTVNGTASTHTWLPAATWKSGVMLNFTLGSTPSTWGTGAGDAPPSYDTSTVPGTGPLTSGIAGKCAQDSDFGTTDGTKIQLSTCDGSFAQKFTPNSDGGLEIMGGCLDVAQGGTADGTLVQRNACSRTGSQVWLPLPDGELLNLPSGKCLDDPNGTTTDGRQLQISTCDDAPRQMWTLPS